MAHYKYIMYCNEEELDTRRVPQMKSCIHKRVLDQEREWLETRLDREIRVLVRL